MQRRTLEALKARERIDAETLAAALDIESDSAAHILWAMCAERVLVVDQEEDTALDTIFKPNPIIHFAFCDESDQRLTLSTLHTRVKAVKAFCDEHAE